MSRPTVATSADAAGSPLDPAPHAAGAGKAEETGLSAVVCPLVLRELPQAIANFALWNDTAPPGPPAFAGQRRPRLIFSFNGAYDADAEAQLVHAFAAAPKVREAFATLEVRFLDLPEEKDRYIRKPSGPTPRYGNKSGPNWMFYETTKALRGEADFIFLMEVDCTPLVPNWLRRLARTCARNDDAWVLGAHYSGASPLLWRVARHINGNALYKVGDPEFGTFLDEILWPWMHEHIAEHDPNLAYDCAWETFLNRGEMDDLCHADWIVSRGVLHKFRLIDTLVNVGGHAEQTGEFVWTRQDLLRRFPAAAVAHGPVTLTAGHRRGRYNVGRANAVDAVLDDGRVTLTSAAATFRRSIWPASGMLEAGDTVTVGFDLVAHPHQLIGVDLREPTGRIVERRKAFAKEDGTRRVRLEFVVPRRLNYLNVVLLVLREDEAVSPITVEELTVSIESGGATWRMRAFAAD